MSTCRRARAAWRRPLCDAGRCAPGSRPVGPATVLDLESPPVAGAVLMVLGLVCVILGFLLAFTLYGIAALVVGAGCAGTGMVLLLVRQGPSQGPTSTRGH